MILREFLYVDTDKVRAMLAQLDDGIAEERRETTKQDRRTEGGFKGFAGHYQGWGEEKYVTKSLGDVLFPSLEDALESEGLIKDLSEELQDQDYWVSQLRESVPPGSLVRITSQGSLFDARYIAASLAGFGATYRGLEAIGADIPSTGRAGAKGKSSSAKSQSRRDTDAEQIEDLIPDFPPIPLDSGKKIDRDYLRGIVQISRGLFMPGLHLNLHPTDDDTFTIGARLQEGRHFLDGDSEILFARYGAGRQEWTLVGTVGHYAPDNDQDLPAPDMIIDEDGRVRRGKMTNMINLHIRYMGGVGFVDVPQWPGFNVVPLAVYRTIPRINHMPPGAGE